MQKVEDGLLVREPRSQSLAGFSGRTQLFSPKVEKKVLYALDFINNVEDATVRDTFRVGLGSVMVSFSNYSYEPSLTRRAAVDKDNIEEANVGFIISAKLHLMAEDIAWVQKQIGSVGYGPRTKVFSKSIFSALQCLEERNFVDLNGAGENQSFGKFWQTVRALQPISLNFELPELANTIRLIRNRNTGRGCYGGRGWANYVATYFNDTYDLCNVVAELLRPNAAAVIVLGNSIIQGIEVKTDYFFGKIGELVGLKFEDNHLLRNKRTGSSIIQSTVRVEEAKDKTVLYESGVVLRKAA